MFPLKLSSYSECIADEMSPNALKDEAFWGSLAEILREIGPSDQELETIRKRLMAQLKASSAPIVLKEILEHQKH